MRTEEHPDIQQWSDRVLALAGILKPLVDKTSLGPDDLEQAAQQAAPWYNGTPPTHTTIRNLLRRFKEKGLDGLERDRYRNKGQSNLSPLLIQHVKDYILDESRPSLKEVWRDAKKYAREVLELPTPPTYDQIRYINANIPNDLKLMGREGRKAYRDKQELVERFDAEYPNQLWQGDAHLLDIILVDEIRKKKTGRPWMTAFIDDYSRSVPGMQLEQGTPNSMTIALALRHAMLPKAEPAWVMQGIPEELYIDNGKQFISKHIEGVCHHYKIDLNPHEPYLARAKGKIERFFRTLEEQCISKLDGYVGSNVKNRPRRVRPKLTLEELKAKIVTYLLEEYHEEPHNGLKRRQRWVHPERERFIRLVNPNDERSLDFLLRFEDRKVGREGIRLNNRFYYDEERRIQPHIGAAVRVFYDSRDYSRIYVYLHHEGDLQFICIAQEQGVKPKSLTDRQAVAARGKAARQPLEQEVRDARSRRRSAKRAMEQVQQNKPTNDQSLKEKGRVDQVAEAEAPKLIRFRHQIKK